MNSETMPRSPAEQFLWELEHFSFERIDIPPVRIPNWPRGAGKLEIALLNTPFTLPRESRTKRLFELEPSWGDLHFTFQPDGEIEVRATSRKRPWGHIPWVRNWSYYLIVAKEHYFSSAYKGSKWGEAFDHVARPGAIYLFDRHKETLFPLIIAQLKNDALRHPEAVRAVTAALEPFIPSLVADELTS